MRPFVKWAGGKSQLVSRLVERVPAEFGTYHEPFLGGGALYLRLASTGRLDGHRARLSDSLYPLMNFWRCASEFGPEVQAASASMPDDPATYALVRDEYNALLARASIDDRDVVVRSSSFSLAKYFYYLNRTSFNGLYRTSRAGRFNSPYADPKKMSKGRLGHPDLRAASEFLQRHLPILSCCPYQCSLDEVRGGDFAYLDPPYYPVKPTSFTAYSGQFGPAEHEHLAEVCHALHGAGVKFLLSNSDTPEVRRLWGRYTVEEVRAVRTINSDSSNRGAVGELLVRNY